MPGGRPKQSLALAKLKGATEKNPQRYRDREDKKAAMTVTKDSYQAAKKEWLRETQSSWKLAYRELSLQEIISEADVTQLRLAFDNLDIATRLRRKYNELLKKDITAITEDGYSPLDTMVKTMNMINKAESAFNSIMYRFGFTPLERQKLHMEKPEEKDELSLLFEKIEGKNA